MQELSLTASTADTTEMDNVLLLKQAPDAFGALALYKNHNIDKSNAIITVLLPH